MNLLAAFHGTRRWAAKVQRLVRPAAFQCTDRNSGAFSRT